jgi:hypothetical protein
MPTVEAFEPLRDGAAPAMDYTSKSRLQGVSGNRDISRSLIDFNSSFVLFAIVWWA